ncbi:LLM class flavin-dependent oxidoreductase [Actinoplanes sp. G11-F43]|uniref:LLM class flavin-dependent oxidoreductase n=1 Tax=Actinoplanes sp. G11-F43 TaxID=3424130 RepID=UPI003D3338B0
MTHRVRFGALVTSVAAARQAEQLGYDLVAVPDGPETDSWTLLTWIAGQTERVGLATIGLPTDGREPTVIGRAAASLDLLSGGRLHLGLIGRHTGEVTQIVQGILDAGETGPLRFAGTHHRVPKAQRGPLPAHRVPIWLSGNDPESLRTAGRHADAWLADLAVLSADDLATAHKTIDQAAADAGRDPGEIRRILIVEPGLGPDELLTLGADTFLVRAEQLPTLDAWSSLRDTGPATVYRPPSVLARRRDGIDYDAIPASLAETAVEPGDLDYARVRNTYMRGGAPGLVLRPRTTAEVSDALAFARAHPDLPLGIRSAGHGISGRSTNNGGIVISLAAMNGIEILDHGQRLIRVGPGARWMDVAQFLAPHGWALSSGDYGGVGVGGLATAGGVGWLAREHGLTIDHLRGVEMVLADGSVVRASAGENSDLFWAVRGAGANLGVVTSFDFAVDEVGDVGFAQLVVAADDPAGLLVDWGRAIEAAPRTLSGQLIMGGRRPGQPAFAQLMAMVDSADPETIIDTLQPIAAVAPLYQQNVTLQPYASVMSNAADGYHQGQGDPVSRSGLIEHLTPEFAAAAAALIASGAVHWFQIRTVGGAVADVDPAETAYAHRTANFSIAVMGSSKRRVDEGWAALLPHFDGLYLSFETDPSPARVADAFPGATMERLRLLKRRYDPTNLFRDNFFVEA